MPNANQLAEHPCQADTDGDGVANEMDNCPELPNPEQAEAAPGIGIDCVVPNGEL